MTLTQLFTNIANAIRAKTGSSETIKAEDFPTEIADITTGHLDNTEYAEANDDLDDILEGSTPMTIYPPDWSQIGYEDTPQSIIDDFNYSREIQDNWDSTQTNLSNKFSSNTILKYMPLVDTSNATSMSGMFRSCSKLEVMPLLNTSSVTNMQSMFSNCTSLVTIPLIDVSNVESMFGMFQSCANLISIPQLDTRNVTSMFVAFQNCTKLRDVPILNTSKLTTIDSAFINCSSLSNDSLNNIMQMCIGATSYKGTKTLKYLGLSSTQATTCQSLSNYQAFLDAGWTTGY